MAQRDQGMRMLINDEEDEEDDEDEDEDEDDDDDDVDAADDGDDGDDDDDEEGEMMTLYQPEISSRGGGASGGTRGGIEPRPAGGEGGELESFHVSNGPAPWPIPC